MREMRQLILYLIAAPLLLVAIGAFIYFKEPKKSEYYWWGPDRETYVMFSTVQQFQKGVIEVRARGKDFYKPGVPFKGEWLVWNNSFFPVTVRLHIWIYDQKFETWTEFTLKDKSEIITLAPMAEYHIETIGYINPDIMTEERISGFKIVPTTRSITLNLIVSNPDQPQPDLHLAMKLKKLENAERNSEEEIDADRSGSRVNAYDDFGH
jgi:hypothetical protein